MKSFLRAGLAAVALMCAGVAQAETVQPNYGSMTLTTGFTPDPQLVGVVAGGDQDVATLTKGQCTGHVSNNPDFAVTYTAGETFNLFISTMAWNGADLVDTTLIVQKPDGSFVCDDDSGDLNLTAMLELTHPQSGTYFIWVGTYNTDTAKGILQISEVQHF